MTIGIYSIRNKYNNKIYIGKSLDIENRLNQHKNKSSNLYLRNDIEELGLGAFDFSILKICNNSKLDLYERKYIKQYQENGFNLYNISLIDGKLQKANTLDDTIDVYGLVYIKSNDDYLINKLGEIYSKKQYRFISTYYRGNKKIVTLCKNGKKKTYKIDDLLAEAFGDEGLKIVLENQENELNNLLESLNEEIKEIENEYIKMKKSKDNLLNKISDIKLKLKEL
jgi:excinuclease UvrABC nuclease subunit